MRAAREKERESERESGQVRSSLRIISKLPTRGVGYARSETETRAKERPVEVFLERRFKATHLGCWAYAQRDRESKIASDRVRSSLSATSKPPIWGAGHARSEGG